MRCIRCNTDNNLRERTANQGRCKNCNHPFVFAPAAGSKLLISDRGFSKTITTISADNTLYYTPKQFWYFLNRVLKKQQQNSTLALVILYCFIAVIGGIVVGILALIVLSFPMIIFLSLFPKIIAAIPDEQEMRILAIFLVAAIEIYFIQKSFDKPDVSDRNWEKSLFALRIFGIILSISSIYTGIAKSSALLYAIGTATGLSAIWLSIIKKREKNQLSENFDVSELLSQNLVIEWQQVNGPIEKLLPPVSQQSSSLPQPRSLNAEIATYSFDRAIICEKEEVAQMLIANNFHFENNCAILSLTGYPFESFNSILEMLRRNPNLQVYAFHDLSPAGLRLPLLLRQSPDWFANPPVPIIDVGLTPAQLFAANRSFAVRNDKYFSTLARSLEPEILAALTPKQRTWLEAGNYIELESFTPKMLIRILQRCIGREQEVTAADSGFVLLGESSDTYIYGIESFG